MAKTPCSSWTWPQFLNLFYKSQQGTIKAALVRVRDEYAAAARQLGEDVLAAQEDLDAARHTLGERAEENAALASQVRLAHGRSGLEGSCRPLLFTELPLPVRLPAVSSVLPAGSVWTPPAEMPRRCLHEWVCGARQAFPGAEQHKHAAAPSDGDGSGDMRGISWVFPGLLFLWQARSGMQS